MNTQYGDVIRRMFPQHSVPDHMAVLSFNGDDEGIAFHEWWESQGAELFAKWFEKQREQT